MRWSALSTRSKRPWANRMVTHQGNRNETAKRHVELYTLSAKGAKGEIKPLPAKITMPSSSFTC